MSNIEPNEQQDSPARQGGNQQGQQNFGSRQEQNGANDQRRYSQNEEFENDESAGEDENGEKQDNSRQS